MHDSMMAQIGMDHEHHHHDSGFGGSDGWVDISNSYNSSQHQSPYTNMEALGLCSQSTQWVAYGTLHPEDTSTSTTAYKPPAATTPHYAKSSNMAQYVNKPSKLLGTTGCNSSSISSSGQRQWYKIACNSRYSVSTETLTDSDRRRMCQYHEENPSVKQTEIGGKKIMSSILWSCLSLTLKQQCSVLNEGIFIYTACVSSFTKIMFSALFPRSSVSVKSISFQRTVVCLQ